MNKNFEIFVDLDETLINTRVYIKGSEKDRVKLTIGNRAYYTKLRPAAQDMLRQLREIGCVKMLTVATKDYAEIMNETFKLGFESESMIGRDQYLYHTAGMYVSRTEVFKKYPIEKDSTVLIDNNGPREEYARLKMEYLSISPYRYFQVREYSGGKDPDKFNQEWRDIIGAIRYISNHNDSFKI